jgi:hypothetical protein
MPILQNLNQVTVRVTNYPGQLIAQHTQVSAKHAKCIDVPDPETKPQPKRKKKSIKYKIERKAITQIKQIKDYGTSSSRPKQSSRGKFHALQPRTTNGIEPNDK